MFRHALRLPFKLLGIPILLDWTFLLVLPILAWLIGRNVAGIAAELNIPDITSLTTGSMPWTLGLIAAIGLFVSVLIHELGHAMTARGYGVRTRNITLWLLGGVAQLERIPTQRGAEAVVAIVGPLVSMVLGVVCWVAVDLVGQPFAAVRFTFEYLAMLNWIIAVFNLIPAMPLDGGRVLRSLLALWMPRMKATQAATGISRVLAILMGLFGLITFNFFLVAIAFFVYLAVESEARNEMIVDLLRGLKVAQVMTSPARTASPDLSVADVKDLMRTCRHLSFPVVDDQQHPLGVIALADVQHADPATRIDALMNHRPPTISSGAAAVDAFNRMGADNFSRLLVTDERGAVAGILTKTDLIRAIQLRGAEQHHAADT